MFLTRPVHPRCHGNDTHLSQIARIDTLTLAKNERQSINNLEEMMN